MSNHKSKNVTLKEVAKRAGVSAMTVSRALSDKAHLVSPETAKRCREIATEMGYVPNLMARSLRGEQLKTIVLFAEFISRHHYLAELVDIVSRSIEGRKYSVISCQSLSSFHQALRNFNLSGAVVIAPPESFYADPFGEQCIGPVVPPSTVLIHSAEEQSDFNEVSPDIDAFNFNAACHLIELGHRHLAYVGGPRMEEEPHWFDLRKSGIQRAMREYGVPTENLHYQPCTDAEMGPIAFQQLLRKAPDTTAIMCLNDEIAVATVMGAQSQQVQVPEALSVIGCNDIRLARFFRPPLTTLGIDIQSMVNIALDLLFDDIQSRSKSDSEPTKIKLSANLIVRGSTAPPPRK
ncbi:MAG: LacI family transcriptional regulator [Phycisphaerales bacterium]|nr:LacI family transcriptional regulator [Phycisphaerales bacterium]